MTGTSSGYSAIREPTTAIFFLTWVMGRDTEHPNLYCSYSDTITTAFFNGVMEVLTDDRTYNYRQIFPNAEIVKTDAKLETIDLQRKKHYPTLTCRSLYGTLNGACDAEKGIIVSDDLISGILKSFLVFCIHCGTVISKTTRKNAIIIIIPNNWNNKS